MRRLKRRIFAGAICEQIVYNVGNNTKNIKTAEPRPPRFKTEEERRKHKEYISRRNHNLRFNAAFSPASIYSTLTFDNSHEVHTFDEAKRIRDTYFRRLRRHYPEAVIWIYMGRGKSTSRIHFHMVSDGIPAEEIRALWGYGSVIDTKNLRAHNYYDGVDHGADYTALANYLYDHWTPEIGGHRWKATRNSRKPEVEDATEVAERTVYTLEKPPRPPKGYQLVDAMITPYGYLRFRYVVVPDKPKRRKKTDQWIS